MPILCGLNPAAREGKLQTDNTSANSEAQINMGDFGARARVNGAVGLVNMPISYCSA